MQRIAITIRKIIDEHGLEIIDQQKRLLAFLNDYYPKEKRSRYLLELSLKAGIPQKISVIQSENPAVIDSELAVLKHYFKEEYFLEDSAVESVFDCWVDVFSEDSISEVWWNSFTKIWKRLIIINTKEDSSYAISQKYENSVFTPKEYDFWKLIENIQRL